MALASGTRLGPYEVTGSLGAGGMGEVYRAHDTKLGRDVALKVLSDRLAYDAEHLARFRREAHTLASLNHQGIAHLYGLDDSTSQIVLVMELVEGPTLADRIARGPLPIDEALPLAIQICEAVEAAHERGIVHRDLKPANIKVRPDGAIKVLDFGLAKADGAASDAGDLSTMAATSPGIILGTAAYMAPEQAKGGHAGPQADIWAFGCVLFEMLSGRMAFARATFAETIANVVSGSPNLDALPAGTPPAVRRLIRRCLEKDPRARLHHLGDARADLAEARSSPEGQALGQPVTRRPARGLVAVGAVIVAAAAAAGGWWWGQRDEGRAPLTSTRLVMPFTTPPAVLPFTVRHVAISKDGLTVAYAAARNLWVRRMQETEARALDVGGSSPFFSPDGQWLAFFSDTGIAKVPVSGGSRSVIAATTERGGGGVWLDDDTIVFSTVGGLYRVPAGGGPADLIVAPDRAKGEKRFNSPEVLPGGRSVLFTVAAGDTTTRLALAAVDLQTKAVTHVLDDASSARYVETGHLLYAAGPVMKAVPFDTGTLKTTGRPIDLQDLDVGIGKDNGLADYALSPAGTLIFLPPFVQQVPLSLVWIDRRGVEERIAIESRPGVYPRISPDGRRVALDVRGNNRDIWILDLATLTQTRLTDGPTEDMLPAWSRDGRRVFFASDRQGNFDIYSQPADGATGARLEFAAPGFQAPESFTPDGTGLVIDEDFKQVSLVHLSESRHETLIAGSFIAVLGQLSPDGKWIAYESQESGSWEVYVRPFPQVQERREKISAAGGRYPLWSRDGRELFFFDLDGDMMAAAITLAPAFHLNRVTSLFRWRAPATNVQGRPYDVSPVDGRFLAVKPVTEGRDAPTAVSVILNWRQELRKREQAAQLQ